MTQKIVIDDDAAQYDAIDRKLKRLEQRPDVPTGVVVLWKSGVTIPSGWLQCDGTTFASASYPYLAALWATTTLPANPGITGYIAIVRAR